ncbi:MAG: hypothetical protein M1814_002027 [Vezdaea aestivalis]|nr:MAG: hypothetical protein M1814_002027 [Vezdaea aestivalis]
MSTARKLLFRKFYSCPESYRQFVWLNYRTTIHLRRVHCPSSLSGRHALKLKIDGSNHAEKLPKKNESQKAATGSPIADIPEDPFNFAALDEAILKTRTRLQHDLANLRGGGRMDPKVVESILVKLDKAGNQRTKLGDIATVVPKGGRSMMLIAGDQTDLKAISSALMSSSLELNPQPSPSRNPLELQIPIPPPTQESRLEAQKEASKLGEQAARGIRNARQVCKQRLKQMQQAKLARGDDIRRAEKKMEIIVEKGVVEAKGLVDAARKAAMG